jgi:hypothetical protein
MMSAGAILKSTRLGETDCGHTDIIWRLDSCTEEGWGCLYCDVKLGFRPDLDRSHTELKVNGILFDFHEAKLIYVSNGTMGEIISENVAVRCRTENRYDQKSILRFIMDDPNMMPKSTFWQNRAERWSLGGETIREEQEGLPF